MEQIRRILVITLPLLSLSLVLVAASLGFLPGGHRGNQFVIPVLVLLALLPAVVLAVLLRAVRDHSEQTRRYATRDSLTGLNNQSAFWDLLNYELEQAKRHQHRLSLMLVNIDNFKSVNDRYGRGQGDQFLKGFAALFRSAVRKGDIPARVTADTYAVILPVCDEAHGRLAAERMLETVRSSGISVGGRETVPTTVSIGIATYPDHAADAQDLYFLAESMLDHAKTSGKDRVSAPCQDVNIGTLKSAGEKSILVMEALREFRIVPYFQPIISVEDRSVLAYEVLTRIATPERIIPASEFIEAAESMGAIGKINHLLMEQSFRIANEEGYRGTLFLNLSPNALLNADFLPKLKMLMREQGFDSSRIVFEITERDAVKNPEAVKAMVNDLRREGFRFAIDDFGSGYATFHYIRLFDVDYLKVAGEFIRNMDGDGGMDHAIVMNIANLAGHLGIKTIAEYVETAEILKNVRTTGIQYAQGYYIDHPSPGLKQSIRHD